MKATGTSSYNSEEALSTQEYPGSYQNETENRERCLCSAQMAVTGEKLT
jgi:hypothetical protein